MLAFLFACTVPLSDPTGLVADARVLAVRADPPEAEPGAEVQFTALYADKTGSLADAPLDWSFCTATRPVAELGPIAQPCLDAYSEELAPIGQGISVAAALPDDGCSQFGPNPPQAEEGATGGKPADPDVTGGYYQPALVFVDDVPSTLVAARIRCGIANVTQEDYVAWNTKYHDNANPEIGELALDSGSGFTTLPSDGSDSPPSVAAGAEVDLRVAWSECPESGVCGDGICSADEELTACPEDCTTPAGCSGAESYILWNPDEKTLTTRREAISATWFSTDGSFSKLRNGRAGDDNATSVTNGWTAPDQPGEVWLGVVLRDERGGVNYEGYRLVVE